MLRQNLIFEKLINNKKNIFDVNPLNFKLLTFNIFDNIYEINFNMDI